MKKVRSLHLFTDKLQVTSRREWDGTGVRNNSIMPAPSIAATEITLTPKQGHTRAAYLPQVVLNVQVRCKTLIQSYDPQKVLYEGPVFMDESQVECPARQRSEWCPSIVRNPKNALGFH